MDRSPVTAVDVLTDGFTRIEESTAAALEGLTVEQLHHRPTPTANSIAWLVWHLTRVQDDHVAGVAGTEQVYVSEGWHERCALPLPVADHGYGHSAEQVGMVQVEGPELLLDYLRAVTRQTVRYLESLTEEDLSTVVDTRWDPPVTLSVRLVSVVSDDLQHAGQAAYLRGLLTA